MSKIARFGDTVYMHVVENDDNPATESWFVINRKRGDGDWEAGPRFPTSRPGNLVVDSTGALHAFVFDPLDVVENDSYGMLEHYAFPQRGGGRPRYDDPRDGGPQRRYRRRDGEHTLRRVHRRRRHARSAFGLTEGNGYNRHTQHLYSKRAGDEAWAHLIAGERLGRDFYYSFPVVAANGLGILAI
jgi:hypothetical protein